MPQPVKVKSDEPAQQQRGIDHRCVAEYKIRAPHNTYRSERDKRERGPRAKPKASDVQAARATQMTSTDVATIGHQPPPTKTKRKLTVTRRVKTAIDAMVWQGLKRAEAAQTAGLQEHSLYVALTRPHVKAHYLAQCEVLRVSGRARRIHRLDEISEQDANKQAAVNAILALEGLGEEATVRAGQSSTPGFVIVINQAAPLMGHQPQTEVNPLKTIDAVGTERVQREDKP